METLDYLLWFFGVNSVIEMFTEFAVTGDTRIEQLRSLGDYFITSILPAVLVFLICGVGMSLTAQNFRYLLNDRLMPRANVLVGVVSQFVMLPIFAVAAIFVFGLTGAIAAGLLLLALCPAGSTGTVITAAAKCNAALAASLTLLSGLIIPFLLPFLYNLITPVIAPEMAAEIRLDVVDALIALFRVSVLPLLIGMLIRYKFPAFVAKIAKVYSRTAIALLAFVIVLILFTKWSFISGHLLYVGFACLALNSFLLAFSFFSARALTDNDDAFAVAMETSIQNGTLALQIAINVIGSVMMAIPIIIYSVGMYICAFTMLWLYKRYQHRQQLNAA